MKIAIDLTALAFNFSGIERYALNVASRLIKMNANDEFELFFCNKVHPAFQTDVEQNDHIHVHILKSGSKKWDKLVLFQCKLPKELKKVRADCYLFLSFEPPILFHKKNMISVLHDLGFFDCPEMWKWYVAAYGRIKTRAAVKHCGTIIAVSNDGRERLRERFSIPPEDLAVAYNAIDDIFKTGRLCEADEQAVLKKYDLPCGGGYFLCLATLEPRKNLKLLVQAYAQLYAQGVVADPLVLAGRKGWKIEDLLNAAGDAAKRIIVTGFVDDEDLPTVYRRAKLFVFPSLYEGFGVPPLEALACGTPILVSDIPVFKEIYGDMASFFRNNDVEDLKACLLNPLIYEKKIDGEKVGRYNWQKTAEVVYSVICKTVSKK